MSTHDSLDNVATAFTKLAEGQYKAETDLVERYQTFVAEILRIAVLGIGAFGFFFKDWFAISDRPTCVKVMAAGGVLLFGISAACAIIFRFFATEGLRYYIDALRFMEAGKSERAQMSLGTRESRLSVCIWSKALAALCLGVGGILVALSMIATIFYGASP